MELVGRDHLDLVPCGPALGDGAGQGSRTPLTWGSQASRMESVASFVLLSTAGKPATRLVGARWRGGLGDHALLERRDRQRSPFSVSSPWCRKSAGYYLNGYCIAARSVWRANEGSGVLVQATSPQIEKPCGRYPPSRCAPMHASWTPSIRLLAEIGLLRDHKRPDRQRD